MARVKHHFISQLDLNQTYSAAQYEQDVLELLPSLWAKNELQVMCGGSMMYIDAVTNGIDNLPTISDTIREHVRNIYESKGLEEIRRMLLSLDPISHERVDAQNPRRNIHAVEICLEAGVPCSSLLTGIKKERDFRILKFFIDLPREVLFQRINHRVDQMMLNGLENEARSVYPLRHLNSLNTVGYKELFSYFDGKMDYETAVARIGKNTRVYAKKQLTWLKRANDAKAVDSVNDIMLQI